MAKTYHVYATINYEELTTQVEHATNDISDLMEWIRSLVTHGKGVTSYTLIIVPREYK